MKLFRVYIRGNWGEFTTRHVMEKDVKSALLAVIEDLPADHPLWQAAGWRDVQVFEANQPGF